MVRDAADGVGVWRCDGITAIANVNTLTFESLLEVCEGEYGAAPTQPGHVILAVNCSWGPSSDIGQFWQKCAPPRPFSPPPMFPKPPLQNLPILFLLFCFTPRANVCDP